MAAAKISTVQQPDLFRPERAIHDATSFRDDIDIMSLPFFTPEKSSFTPIEYSRTIGDRTEYVRVSPGEFGLANQWDKDIIIYLRTQIISALNRNETVGRRIEFHVYDFLRAARRHTGSREYDLFRDSLHRLKTTSVFTNLTTSDEIEEQGFGFIESYKFKQRRKPDGKETMSAVEVVVSEWMYSLMIQSTRALAIDPEYFTLKGGLQRAIYGIVRRHLGQQSSWHVSLETLRDLCGSRRELRKFKADIVALCEKGLPGFDLSLTHDYRLPAIAAASPVPVRQTKMLYLVARKQRLVR